MGDRLVVSLTPDRFVNKGPGRPMFHESLRADQIAALGFVDWVVLNDAPTSCALLERLRPDIYIKGAEYRQNADPRFAEEKAIVERGGGRVVFSDDVVVYSSSRIVDTIRAADQHEAPHAGLAALAAGHDLSSLAIARALEGARGKRAMVLSESVLDVYAHCRTPEIAQEHPMLSLHPEREERYDGAGGVIASHLNAMGLDVTLCTPLGGDPASLAFARRMNDAGVRIQPVVCEQPMPVKLRYLVENEKMMKIDSPVSYALGEDCAETIGTHVACAGGYDAMIIADFGLGLFQNRLASRVIDRVRDQVGLIVGDVSGRRADLAEMRGADVLCPCEVELRQMLADHDAPLHELAGRAMEITGAETICITRAGNGLAMFDRSHSALSIPAFCDKPRDVLGCGDALLSAMTVALLGGADRAQGAYIGSLAAGIHAGTHGNLPVGAERLVEQATRISAALLGDQHGSAGATGLGSLVEPRPEIGHTEGV